MRSFVSRVVSPTKVISEIWKNHSRSFLTTIEISDDNKREFIDFVEGESDNPYKSYLSVQESSSKALRSIIPKDSQETLASFGNRGRSLILLQNSPIVGEAGLPPTPDSSQIPENKDYISEYCMLGLAGLIGAKPYLIEGVRDGSIINQIIPLEPKSISGSGSKKVFDFHNEVVHEKYPPDFFLMLCLRGNPQAKTNFIDLSDIIELLPPKILEELQKPNFLMQSGDKNIFKDAKEFKAPILTRNKSGEFEIRLNVAPGRCEGLNDDAKIALDYVSHCVRNEVSVLNLGLSKGDALIINDRKMMHSRSSFDETKIDEKEGGKRWIQRMNLNKEQSADLKNR